MLIFLYIVVLPVSSWISEVAFMPISFFFEKRLFVMLDVENGVIEQKKYKKMFDDVFLLDIFAAFITVC